jgi:hypothetical protein
MIVLPYSSPRVNGRLYKDIVRVNFTYGFCTYAVLWARNRFDGRRMVFMLPRIQVASGCAPPAPGDPHKFPTKSLKPMWTPKEALLLPIANSHVHAARIKTGTAPAPLSN